MNDSLVIIPTYNESENIRLIVDAVINLKKPFDILIVDDGSPDGTATIVKQIQESNTSESAIHLIERKGKQGLGTAYIRGFKFAIEKGYDFIFEMDADFSHNPKDLIRLYESCAIDGNDVAVGSRYVSGVNVVNWPMGRIIMSYFASIYVRFITGMPVNDTTAGFVCFRRKVLETIDLDNIRFIGYAFQIEMKFTALKYGFKISEVGIVFTDRTRGKSKMSGSIFKEAFFGVIKMKIDSLFKKYIPASV
ncbi:MAG TPA: polyprenol monophosphomannose synthase [Fulvivirga sp.]|nr:polyprenol monophosphomannose synthase [Fulvivirga sp.]